METGNNEEGLVAPVVEATTAIVFKVEDTVVNTEVLTKKKDEALLIKITGLDDKEIYEQAKTLNAELRTTRTTLEKFRKDRSAPHQKFVKDLKVITDGYGAICEAGEAHLATQIAIFDDAKKKQKEEKELAKVKVMQERITVLVSLGAKFDGTATYTFPFDDNLIVNTVQLKGYDDAEWDEFHAEVKASWDAEQRHLQAQKDKENQEKINVQTVASQNKVTAINLDHKRTALRLKELKLMGVMAETVGEGEIPTYSHPDDKQRYFFVSDQYIREETDENWDADMLKWSEAIEAGFPVPEKTNIGSRGNYTSVFPEGGPTSGPTEGELPKKDALDELEELSKNVEKEVDVMASLFFNKEYPFKDVDISAKFRLRFYPAEFPEVLSNLNLDVIATSGEIDPASNLRFVLIKI